MPTEYIPDKDAPVKPQPQEAERSRKGNGRDQAARQGKRSGLILEPQDPRQWASELVRSRFTNANRERLIHRNRGRLYVYEGSHYAPLDKDAERGLCSGFLGNARMQCKGGYEPFKPTKHDIEELVDALKAICLLDSSLDPPFWIGDCHGLPPAGECLVVANGILHIPTGRLIPQTPRLFTLSASDVLYDPEAKCPDWDRFRQEVFEEDGEAEALVQEFTGYNLTSDVSFEKILVIIGPKRAGKGTIARVNEALLGESGVTATTIAGLRESFGLQGLIGKTLTIISDARFGDRNSDAVAERLLSISGRDKVPINQKYRDVWVGRLKTKFMILSNEMPRIKDSSGVIVSRFLVIELTQTFYGREDRHLFEGKLILELSGILNWAIEGYKRLYARDRFEQPKSASDTISHMEELASPIMAFVRECCILEEGPSMTCHKLYERYDRWCDRSGNRRASNKVFGADLKAAYYPEIDRRRLRKDGENTWCYTGIRLAQQDDK